MEQVLVVGGGLAGLVASKYLSAHGFSVQGVEAEAHLGGRATVGHHRVYSESTKALLQEEGLETPWIEGAEVARQRLKGEWKPGVEGLEAPTAEKFYLQSPYWEPQTGLRPWIEKLGQEMAPQFQLRKGVSKLDLAQGRVTFDDETEGEFTRLIWCGPLRRLAAAAKGQLPPLAPLAKLPAPEGGISWEVHSSQPPFPPGNTVILPFRFKEWKLRALGLSLGAPEQVQWVVWLPSEVLDDVDEVAKCVRTLKREVAKEFPEGATPKWEKISYLPVVSGEEPLVLESPWLTPKVTYLGPEVSYVGETSHRNLDLTLANWGMLKSALKTWAPEEPSN